AFAQYVLFGNYNYITPYSYEIVHGIFLSLVVAGLLADWLARPRWTLAALIGLGAGLVFLTKPDVFLALAAVLVMAVALHWWEHRGFKAGAKSLAAFGLAAAAPLLFFFLLFLRVDSWQHSLQYLVFGWVPVFEPAVRNNPFYRSISGLDAPTVHVRHILTHFLWAILAIALYAFLFRLLVRWKASLFKWVAWEILILPLCLWASVFHWQLCGYSLPLWCLIILGLLGYRLARKDGAAQLTFPFLWTVFALFLLAKLGLHPRIWNYGFALAMPAFVATVYFLLWFLPRWLQNQFQVPTVFFRATVLVVLWIGYGLLGSASWGFYQHKNDAISTGSNRIISYGPAHEVTWDIKGALDWVDHNVPANGTLAVLPLGVTLNFLAHRVNPTPCLFWDPNCLAVFGEAKMTAAFETAAPDYVLLIDQDLSGFGCESFGACPGCGADVMSWIHHNYQTAVVIGHDPEQNTGFGIKILRRSSLAARPPSQ
ncbi:MAG TPA: hypothetical protein VF988_03325, partial [Verrucomicrobiae bacterium]